MRAFAFLFLLIVAGTALASCPPHDASDPKRMHIASDSVLIVTHATSFRFHFVDSALKLEDLLLFSAKG